MNPGMEIRFGKNATHKKPAAPWRARRAFYLIPANPEQSRDVVSTRTTAADRALGTEAGGGLYALMTDDKPPDKTGNEPAPLLLAAVAIVPLLAVGAWFVFG
jgi:hypothetical protein